MNEGTYGGWEGADDGRAGGLGGHRLQPSCFSSSFFARRPPLLSGVLGGLGGILGEAFSRDFLF